MTDATDAWIERLLDEAPPLPDRVRSLVVADFAATSADLGKRRCGVSDGPLPSDDPVRPLLPGVLLLRLDSNQ